MDPFTIGVTGGIGSGKSAFCRFFEQRNVPVFYADDEVRRMMNEDPQVRASVIKLLGPSAYQKNELDRKWVGSIVFNDPAKLKALTDITSPAIMRRFRKWRDSQTAPFVLMEAATLIESGAHKEVDHIVTVTAPEDVRIKRAMERDKATEEQTRAKLNNQLPEEERLKHANSIIHNDGTIERLEDQAWDLLRYLRRLTA